MVDLDGERVSPVGAAGRPVRGVVTVMIDKFDLIGARSRLRVSEITDTAINYGFSRTDHALNPE